MSENLSAKYYQEDKESLQKRLVKNVKIFQRKKKKKSDNIVVNVTKISQKMKTKSWLNIEKKHRMRKNALF